MSDKCIIANGKVRSLEKCSGRVPEGKLREMYAYNLLQGIDPTDMVTTGIRTTYYHLRKLEGGLTEEERRDPTIVPIKLIVGDDEIIGPSAPPITGS